VDLSKILLHLLRFGKNVAETCFCQEDLNRGLNHGTDGRNLPTLKEGPVPIKTHSTNPSQQVLFQNMEKERGGTSRARITWKKSH